MRPEDRRRPRPVHLAMGALAMMGAALTLGMQPASARAASTELKARTPSQAPNPAQASTRIYRCKQQDGSILYAQDPCPTAAGERVMQLRDARTEAQTKQGEEVQQRSDKLAKSLQRSRQSLERQARGREAIALTPPREPELPLKKGKKAASALSSSTDGRESGKRDARPSKARHPADFTARVPAKPGKKKTSGKRQDDDEG